MVAKHPRSGSEGASRSTLSLWLHFKHTPGTSPSYIGEIEFTGSGRDDLECPCGAGAGEIGVNVRASGQVIGGEHHFFIAQFGMGEIPPAPATLFVISERVRSGNGCI